MACLKQETMIKWISEHDWTWLEYNLGGWNVGEHMLGQKVAERHRCSMYTSVNRLCTTNANQINICANPIENLFAYSANQ